MVTVGIWSYAGGILRKKDQQPLIINSSCIFYLHPAYIQRKTRLTLEGIEHQTETDDIFIKGLTRVH